MVMIINKFLFVMVIIMLFFILKEFILIIKSSFLFLLFMNAIKPR